MYLRNARKVERNVDKQERNVACHNDELHIVVAILQFQMGKSYESVGVAVDTVECGILAAHASVTEDLLEADSDGAPQ